MMTYLSQYPHAKLLPGAPLMPWTPKSEIIATGPGLQPTGIVAGQPTDFLVDISGASAAGPLEVAVVHSASGKQEPVSTCVMYSLFLSLHRVWF